MVSVYVFAVTSAAFVWFTDTFTDSVDVVVEGRYHRDGTFVATTLLAKCASRYENAPDKYQDTPGYRASKGPSA